MKNLVAFLLLLLVFSCSSGEKEVADAPAPLKCHKSFSAKELQEDFDILVTTLQEAHPDLYRVNSKAVINKRIAGIRAQLNDSLTYLEFLKLIAPLFTAIGDIGTQWSHPKEFIEYRNENIPVFPFEIDIRHQRFFVKVNHSTDSSILPGTEIKSFNGETLRDYLVKNYALLPNDGEGHTVPDRWLETYFPNHHSNFWAQPDTFVLVLEKPGGTAVTVKVRALLKKEFRNPWPFDLTPVQAFHVKDSVGILTPLFDMDKRTDAELLEDFSKLIDTVCEKMKGDSIHTLLIDLRDNDWLDLEHGALLFSYLADQPFRYVNQVKTDADTSLRYRQHVLWQAGTDTIMLAALTRLAMPKPNAFHGKVYILANGSTMGACGYFCSRIFGRPKTFFAGEEHANRLYGINDKPLALVLPNSGIAVYIPTRQLIARESDYTDKYGRQLDYPLKWYADSEWLERTVEELKRRNAER